MVHRVFNNTLAAVIVVLAFCALADGHPISSSSETGTSKKCSNEHLNLHGKVTSALPGALKEKDILHTLHDVSEKLHTSKNVSQYEYDLWMASRKFLKRALKTKMCQSSSRGHYCCHVCQDGRKAMFCSYSALLKTKKLKKLRKLVQSEIVPINVNSPVTPASFSMVSTPLPIDSKIEPRNLLLYKDEVTIDLFAITCDNPGGSSLCSEFCCDSARKVSDFCSGAGDCY